MTNDPERLLSVTSDADPFERELLASLQSERAPASIRRGAWQGIAAALVAAAPASAAAGAAASAASGSAGSAAAASSTSGGAFASGSAAVGGKLAAGLGTKAAALLVTKWALVGALSATAVGGAIWAVDRHEARRNAAPAIAPAAPNQRQIAPPAVNPVMPAAAPEALPPPSAAGRKLSKPAHADALAAESALLQSARAELRAGNLDRASLALQQLQRRFPRGVLNQERDVLRIELSSARGDDAAARRLAARFLRAYPESPHAAQLRPLTAAP